eukprot:scaffold5833_cov165-Amphora_coffeaeformis.AAC.21
MELPSTSATHDSQRQWIRPIDRTRNLWESIDYNMKDAGIRLLVRLGGCNLQINPLADQRYAANTPTQA